MAKFQILKQEISLEDGIIGKKDEIPAEIISVEKKQMFDREWTTYLSVVCPAAETRLSSASKAE